MSAEFAKWVTTGLTLVALRALYRVSSGPRMATPRVVRFAMFASGVLMTVCVARWLGVDEGITAWGRSESIEEGWYEERGSYQASVTWLAGAALIASVVSARQLDRRHPRPGVAVPLFWFAAWVYLNLTRVVSEHQVDQILQEPIGPFEFGWLVEWGLLAGLAVTIRRTRRRPRRVHPAAQMESSRKSWGHHDGTAGGTRKNGRGNREETAG